MKLCVLNAQVVQINPSQPRIVLACYICENCGSKIYVPITKQFKSTALCQNCNSCTSVVFSSNDSKFIDEITLLLKNDQGTYSAVWTEIGTEQGLQAKFSIGSHIKLSGFWQIDIPVDDVNRSGYDCTFVIQNFTEIQKAVDVNVEEEPIQPLTIEQLTKMFAPNIQGLVYPKLAILCSLVGSSNTNKRSLLHTLLVGDPGVAKSQLLKEACKLLPKSVFTSGKSTSKAGLTAAVVLAPTRQNVNLTKKQNQVLQQPQSRPQIVPGALLIANGGLVAIDEFDKLDTQDTTAIYEVLEQQTLSIAKAGVSASMPAHTTVIAACNPNGSIWDSSKSIVDNLDIAEALISRFDIVFVMRDQREVDQDKQLGLFVANRFMDNSQNNQQQQNTDTIEKLARYIQYARQLNPEIPPSLYQQYIDYYCKERQQREFTTPRLLLSVIRISQALAKLRLSKYVEKQDLIQAEQLMEASIDASAIQQEPESKKQVNTIRNQIKDLLRRRQSVKLSELKQKFGKETEEELQKLQSLGLIVIDLKQADPDVMLV